MKHATRTTRRPTAAGGRHGGIGPRTVGMTLVELLVSIVILTVMVLSFSTILVQSQRFVSVAQMTRRSHATASAIARIIRNDVRRASQNGFLVITKDGQGQARLILTATGIFESTTKDQAAPPGTVNTGMTNNGAIICYGLCANGSKYAPPNLYVLWRPAFILNRQPFGEQPPTRISDVRFDPIDDTTNLNFADIKPSDPNQSSTLTAPQIADKLAGLNPSLVVPPASLGDINMVWQVLAPDCKNLSIMWTDGSPDPASKDPGNKDLNWYGVKPDGTVKQSDKTDIDGNASGRGYWAIWTNRNQANWPKAIRIRFTIKDRNMPPEFRGRGPSGGLDYEIICSLGQ